MDHGAALLASYCGSPYGIAAALFLMGSVGSLAHCAGMCGPFVLAQLSADRAGVRGPMLLRGALLPYHLGRATTYVTLGAALGGLGGGLARGLPYPPRLLALLLAVAAALFLVQALKGVGLLRVGVTGSGLSGRFGGAVARAVRPLLQGDGARRGYALGLALGFLPCGLLYGALAAAAGTGSALAGAVAMAAFAASTMPLLIAIGLVGAGLAQRWRAAARRLLAPLQALNAALLLAIALATGLAPAG